MIVSEAWRGKRYAVLGLARSGAATVRALLASGASVVAWDEREEARGAIEGAMEIADPLTLDLTGFDGVVVSPGVPLNTHPIAAHAAKFGVPVIGDIELFAQARGGLPPHKVIGITGTNGKSTTTALVHHILKTAGVPTTMGGNIGLPILGQKPLPEGGVYVLELSSYQIDLTFTLDSDVAVLLNITPDHLDRYESFEAYAASKARLFEMQSEKQCAVFGVEDGEALKLHDALAISRDGGHVGLTPRPDRVFGVSGSYLSDPDYGPWLGERFKQWEWPSLPGPHNAQNASAALAVCNALQVEYDAIEAGLRTYPGLPHRMERVAEIKGVGYVNDSKATNPTSTAPALAAFDTIHWILGGRAKGADLDACRPHFDHVRFAYTIGEAGPMFTELLQKELPTVYCGTLEKAVIAAHAIAEPGETVLLSPACASFDQFRDFEARGDAFRAAVEAL